MMDKVCIDILCVDLLDVNNEIFLVCQVEFELNVRSYLCKLLLVIIKVEGVWLMDVDNKQYLDCFVGVGIFVLGYNYFDVLQSI